MGSVLRVLSTGIYGGKGSPLVAYWPVEPLGRQEQVTETSCTADADGSTSHPTGGAVCPADTTTGASDDRKIPVQLTGQRVPVTPAE